MRAVPGLPRVVLRHRVDPYRRRGLYLGMRLANVTGRLSAFVDGQLIDIERESQGRFGADPQVAYERWDDLVVWGRSMGAHGGSSMARHAGLEAPVPRPRQLFAVGLNYRDHAEEVGMPLTARPTTFTKCQSCLTGPDSVVELASDTTDWEAELVVVIARHAYRVPLAEAAGYVAGYTIGQDLSERTRQMEGSRRSSAWENPTPDTAQPVRGW